MTALLDDILARLATMPASEKAELQKAYLAESPKWLPTPGPQTQGYLCQADELFYGGEAGGGKSDLLMGLSLTEHKRSLILRRTNKEASKLVERYAEILGSRDGWNGQENVWRIDDRVIDIGGCQHEDDKQKYKGTPHDLIAFDEISDFTETQYTFIIAWNRSADEKQRCRIVAAGNPPTRPEGLWVTKRWAAWLDKKHPKPAKPGELRWYTTGPDGREMEVDGPGPHMIGGEMIKALSRTFIRARLSDNPFLSNTNYAANLAALPEELRLAYRDGRFDMSLKDDPWQVIPTAWVLAAQARWRPDGHKGLSMTAMALDPAGGGSDAAELARRYGGWYAEWVTTRGPETANGSLQAASIVTHRKDGCPVVLDVGGGYAGAVIERFKDNGIPYERHDGGATSTAVAKHTGHRFHNKRSEAYWTFREELDPEQEGGSNVALPPDNELLADLTAHTWELGPKGIKVCPKEDVKERIGRSPGKGDSCVMCMRTGNKAAMKRAQSMLNGGRMPQVVMKRNRRR